MTSFLLGMYKNRIVQLNGRWRPILSDYIHTGMVQYYIALRRQLHQTKLGAIVVEQTHIRNHPAICTELPTFQLVVRVGGFEGLRKNRCLLNTVLLFTLLLCCAV